MIVFRALGFISDKYVINFIIPVLTLTILLFRLSFGLVPVQIRLDKCYFILFYFVYIKYAPFSLIFPHFFLFFLRKNSFHLNDIYYINYLH